MVPLGGGVGEGVGAGVGLGVGDGAVFVGADGVFAAALPDALEPPPQAVAASARTDANALKIIREDRFLSTRASLNPASLRWSDETGLMKVSQNDAPFPSNRSYSDRGANRTSCAQADGGCSHCPFGADALRNVHGPRPLHTLALLRQKMPLLRL